jgi:cell division protein ZapA
MAQVNIRINGRTYEVNCENGQEQHVQRLANSLANAVGELVKQVGQVGDARLLVMAGLVMADEMAEQKAELAAAKTRIEALEKQGLEKERARAAAEELAQTSLRRAEAFSNRLDGIARRLSAS